MPHLLLFVDAAVAQHGFTALHMASNQGHAEVVRALLRGGAHDKEVVGWRRGMTLPMTWRQRDQEHIVPNHVGRCR